MIIADHLTKVIHHKKIVNDLSFKCEKGKVYGLIGPRGSGKTTIVKLIAGILKPTSGSIICPKQISFFMGDDDFGLESVDVKRYLKFIRNVYRKDINTELLYTIISELSVPLDSKVSDLSNVEKVKLELAIVLARDSDVYLFDEPLNEVDEPLRQLILENILKYIHIDNKIVMITSQNINEIEKVIDEVISV